MCNKSFDTLFLPILLYSSEVWGAYNKIDPGKKWEKGPIKKLQTQFHKYYMGLNRRARQMSAGREKKPYFIFVFFERIPSTLSLFKSNSRKACKLQ